MEIHDNPVGQNAILDFPTILSLFPDVTGARVLDLGCGPGDICRYAVEQGARSAIGVDQSQEMIALAKQRTDDPRVIYVVKDIVDFEFKYQMFDLIVCSLTLHYVDSYNKVLEFVKYSLRPGCIFLFSIEHPIYTAPRHGWIRANDGARDSSTPLDYGAEGLRIVPWLGFKISKYHRKLETYLGTLLTLGFTLRAIREPQPAVVAAFRRLLKPDDPLK